MHILPLQPQHNWQTAGAIHSLDWKLLTISQIKQSVGNYVGFLILFLFYRFPFWELHWNHYGTATYPSSMHIYSTKCYLVCFLNLFKSENVTLKKIWRVTLANSLIPSQQKPIGATL